MLKAEIFQQENFRSYISEIKKLVSCPDEIYQELYLKTLCNVAALTQSLDFFDDQLKLVVATLKLRRGALFPKNAGAEKISSEEAQWTYALFSAALLKKLYLLQQHNDLATFIAGMLPDYALKWLSANVYLFNQWQEVITNKSCYGNEIEKIIQLATEKISLTLKNTNQDAFIAYLLQETRLNTDHIFKMKIGVFVSTELIDNFIFNNKPLSKTSFMQSLEKNHWLILNNDQPYHAVTPKQLQDIRILQGIILNTEALPEALQNMPLNTYFQKQIAL